MAWGVNWPPSCSVTPSRMGALLPVVATPSGTGTAADEYRRVVGEVTEEAASTHCPSFAGI